MENRINVQIPHRMRMALGILADSVGMNISTFCRGLLDNFVNLDTVRGSVNGKKPSREAWQRVAAIWNENGPEAKITIRVTDSTMEALNDVVLYNRSQLIRSVFLSYIVVHKPKTLGDRALQMTADILEIAEKAKKLTLRISLPGKWMKKQK